MKTHASLASWIGMVVLAMASLATVTVLSQTPQFDGRGWTVGNHQKTAAQSLTEYVLPGQTVDTWKELVTSTVFVQPVPIAPFVERIPHLDGEGLPVTRVERDPAGREDGHLRISRRRLRRIRGSARTGPGDDRTRWPLSPGVRGQDQGAYRGGATRAVAGPSNSESARRACRGRKGETRETRRFRPRQRHHGRGAKNRD